MGKRSKKNIKSYFKNKSKLSLIFSISSIVIYTIWRLSFLNCGTKCISGSEKALTLILPLQLGLLTAATILGVLGLNEGKKHDHKFRVFCLVFSIINFVQWFIFTMFMMMLSSSPFMF